MQIKIKKIKSEILLDDRSIITLLYGSQKFLLSYIE